MTTLIAGRFSQQTQAESASAELLRSGFLARDMSLFYVNPQGQHDLHLGGDQRRIQDQGKRSSRFRDGLLAGEPFAAGNAAGGVLHLDDWTLRLLGD